MTNEHKLRKGECVALALSNRECPIGIVTEINETRVVLDLYSFFTHRFTAGVRSCRLDDIVLVKRTRKMNAEEQRERGFRDCSIKTFDIDPLAKFQDAWTMSNDRPA